MLVPPTWKQRLRRAVLRSYELALFAGMVAAVGMVGVSTAPPAQRLAKLGAVEACTAPVLLK